MKLHSLVLSLIVIPAVALLGCSDSGQGAADRKPTHKVSGTITMAGGPVIDAAVTFSPRSGQPPALGRTDSSGKYVLQTYEAGDGAVEGDYAVLVTKSGGSASSAPSADEVHKAVSSGGPPPASHGGRSGSSKSGDLLPDMYSKPDSTPFKATVLPDKENVFDFDIKP